MKRIECYAVQGSAKEKKWKQKKLQKKKKGEVCFWLGWGRALRVPGLTNGNSFFVICYQGGKNA